MTVAWLLYYFGSCEDPAALGDAFSSRFGQGLGSLPGAMGAALYSATGSHDPLLKDEIGPKLIVKVSFQSIENAETALAPVSDLNLADFDGPPAFRGRVCHELMMEERYPVRCDPAMEGPLGKVSYFVLYDGPAEDVDAFRRYYHTNHPPILGRMTGIRSTLLGTPVGWRDPLGIADAGHMHLCDISFESVSDLNAGLASHARVELREDFANFPPFEGAVTHQAMVRRAL